MDALSEALNAVRMTSAFVLNAEFSAPWGFTSPDPATLMPLLAPEAERLVMYHLVIEGEASAQIAGAPEVGLVPGDIAIIQHGDAHTFSHGKPLRLLDLTHDVFRQASDLTLTKFGGGGATTRFVCGYFGCERRAEQLFLCGLPRVIKINIRGDAAGRWLEHSMRHLASEAGDTRPGNLVLRSKMAEALFIEALRRYMAHLTPGQTGWLAGARDPVVGRALALLHHDARRPWRLAELAAQTGASRSVVTERFAHFLGTSPLSYLARWRMQLAARLLESTPHTIVQVAAQVGYESEAAFSRAFSRAFGLPPARYRKRAQQGAGRAAAALALPTSGGVGPTL